MTYISNLVRPERDPKVVRTGPSSIGASDKLARALGWFSIGLGVAELIAARRITRALGMEGREGLVRAYGAREIASGMMSLSPDKKTGLWSRVIGDGIDIATLMSAMRDDNPKQGNVMIALAMVLGVTMFDFVGAQGVTARHGRRRGARAIYRDRSGFSKGLQAARGAAKDFRQTLALRSPTSRAAH